MTSQISDAELLRYAREVQVEILEDLGRYEEAAALEPLERAPEPSATITNTNHIDGVQRTVKQRPFGLKAKRARKAR